MEKTSFDLKELIVFPKNNPFARALHEHTRLGPPRLLIVDDDPLFEKLMVRSARHWKIAITSCRSWATLRAVATNCHYDAAVVDYHLENHTGTEVARFLGNNVPVILISQNENLDSTGISLPKSIVKFIPKSEGIPAILAATLQVIAPDKQSLKALSWDDGVESLSRSYNKILPWLMAAAVVALLTLLFFASMQASKPFPVTPPFQWDRAPIAPFDRVTLAPVPHPGRALSRVAAIQSGIPKEAP